MAGVWSTREVIGIFSVKSGIELIRKELLVKWSLISMKLRVLHSGQDQGS